MLRAGGRHGAVAAPGRRFHRAALFICEYNPDIALGIHGYAKRGRSTNAPVNQTAVVGAAVVGIVLVLLALVVLANLR